LPQLKNLSELHINSNRLTGLPSNLAAACPVLDLLDISDNRISDISSITNAIKNLKELKELIASGNVCTPRDVNGNIFGDECMKWWFALVGVCVNLEVCDDLIASSDDVAATVKALGREREIEERRSVKQVSERTSEAERSGAKQDVCSSSLRSSWLATFIVNLTTSQLLSLASRPFLSSSR